jgi:Fe2+ transport system protein FeoA
VQQTDGIIPLNRLTVGQSAYVSQVVGQLDHVHRLEELGLRDGTRVEMFRPGNPCIIRLAGNKVCLRADSLLSVLVKPNGTSLKRA